MKIEITKLIPNDNNPRFIKDANYKKLIESIKEDPEFLEAREIVVNKEYKILGGNQRYRAAKELGIKEIPVKIVDWPEEKQRKFVIKDNTNAGDWDWDILANEWETNELEDWGVNLPSFIETAGTIDHFRDVDDATALPTKDAYDNSSTNTLILIYSDEEYKTVIEQIRKLINKDNDSPSKVILELLKNAGV